MPLKCCSPSCNSNYESLNKKITVYKFSVDKIKRKFSSKQFTHKTLVVTKYTAVYKKNASAKLLSVYEKHRPAQPP